MSYSVIESENVRSRDVLSRAGNQIWKIGLICLKKKMKLWYFLMIISEIELRKLGWEVDFKP